MTYVGTSSCGVGYSILHKEKVTGIESAESCQACLVHNPKYFHLCFDSKFVGLALGTKARWRKVRPSHVTEVHCIRSFWVWDGLGNDGDARKPTASFEPQSPTGQFLVQILMNYPHLFPAAADQQLEQLSVERDACNMPEQLEISESYLVLYRRISILKAEERQKAVEEVIYALMLQKFLEASIEMVPNMESLLRNRRDGIFSSQQKNLESVHSPEALEMMREHLTMVLGSLKMDFALNPHTLARISKFHFSQIYAISIMYGYFLRRVDQCFQLEMQLRKEVQTSPEAYSAAQLVVFEEQHKDEEEFITGSNLAAEAAEAVAALRAKFTQSTSTPSERKLSKLGAYIMSFDSGSFGKFMTMRANETVNVIERRAGALFGKPELHITRDGRYVLPKDDTVEIAMPALKEVMLEAVTFGSFLWEVESYVDSLYNIVSEE